MNNIDKIIKENREMFIDREPSMGHFERFEKKLARQNGRKKTIKFVYRISRFAAVGLLLLMSSLWAYNEFIKPEEVFMNLGEVSPEYKEVEFFLTSQINSKYEELKNYEFKEDESFKETLLVEINQMDSIYTQLQKEMNANPGDDRIVEAMIRHYQTKLNVITEILQRLESYNENNNSNSNNQNQYESVKL